jgi:zinc protease
MKIRLLLIGAIAALGLAAQTTVTEVPSTLTKSPTPTGDTVLQHFVDATGGKTAYDAVKTRISTGTFTLTGKGINGSYKLYQAAPAKAYAVIDIQGVGKIEDGTDGKVAWELSAMTGARIKTDEEAAAEFRDAALDAHTNWKGYYKSAEVTGSDSVGDKSCWKVVMTPNKGAPETDWFDKTSGLLLKESAITETPMGKIPVDADYSDYRKQGDILLPFKVTQTVAGQQYEIALDKVELNVDIPDSRFAIPAEIRALEK